MANQKHLKYEPNRVEISEAFLETLSDILLYGFKNWGGLVTVKFLDKINKAILKLYAFPNLYPKSTLLKGTVKKNYRSISIKPYNIFYSVEDNLITIINIIHQRQSPTKQRRTIKKAFLK
jgi:plasmid stabilization system protein ParE